MDLQLNAIEALVFDYQKGSQDAAEILLSADFLQPLVYKIARLIGGRGYSHNSSISVKWVLAWTAGEERMLFRKHYKQAQGYQIAQKSLFRARDLIEGYWDREDVLQEIQLSILELALQYKPKDSSFLSYLVSSLPFQLKNKITKFCEDSSTKKSALRVEKAEKMLLVEDVEQTNHGEHALELDESWVLGVTSNELFQRLSSTERDILKRIDLDGQSGKDVSADLNIPISTVYFYRTRAIEKLKKQAIKDRLIDE